jgi:hypothetical protein
MKAIFYFITVFPCAPQNHVSCAWEPSKNMARTRLSAGVNQQRAIMLAKVQSEHRLTRSLRSIFMLVLMGVLILVGVLLRIAGLIAGQAIAFNPRWQSLPQGTSQTARVVRRLPYPTEVLR